MGSSATRTGKKSGINIRKSGKYSLVLLDDITIVERPAIGEESSKLFYNPRDLESFTPEEMAKLEYSIRVDGLRQPPEVRAISEHGNVVRVELMSGERRVRSCTKIRDEDLPCFDAEAPKPKRFSKDAVVVYKGRFGTVVSHSGASVSVTFNDDIGRETKECDYSEVYPTVSGAKHYNDVWCLVHFDCSDERAIRLAFTENDNSLPLNVKEEINLVERLVRTVKPDGSLLSQDEIAEILGSNITWVSQTLSFRNSLPKEVFDKLVKGEIVRNVAVCFLSYPQEDRSTLFKSAAVEEQKETAEKIKTNRIAKETSEDEEELHLATAKKAEQAGNTKLAEKARRKAGTAKNRAEKAAERLNRATSESGHIKQGHIKRGAAAANLSPRKAKSLDKDEIDAIFIRGMQKYVIGGEIDPETGNEIPTDLAEIVKHTALAIVNGSHDPIAPIRNYMRESGQWEQSEFDTETSAPSVRRRGRRPDDDADSLDGEDFDPAMVAYEDEPSYTDEQDLD